MIFSISTNGTQRKIASTILAGYHRTNMTGWNDDNAVLYIKTKGGDDMTEHFNNDNDNFAPSSSTEQTK